VQAPVLSGVAVALAAALAWAVALRLFHGLRGYWQPAALAWVKSVLAALMFLAYFALQQRAITDLAPATALALLASGVVGIALGDTALFFALYRMAERRTLLVAETAAPVFVALAALVLLDERLAAGQVAGMVLVLFGVDTVLGLRSARAEVDWIGVTWALLAALCQMVGVIISRVLLVETSLEADLSALWRILGACVALPLWLLLRREPLRPARVMPGRDLLLFLFAVLVGTFLGILGLQTAIDLLPAGLAQTLIATTVVFSTVFAALLGERISRRQWLGTLIAVTGVAFIALT
jgi:drug/metabolite transporter (DMT)-like permease